MAQNILITTTNDLGDNKILKFHGVVSSHIVIGANFFADFFASFTDVFGGHSGAYQQRLEEMFDESKKHLIKETKMKGGNAIIGFSIEFDEVSGKDKSMFMVSAIGTAVTYEEEKNEYGAISTISGTVSAKMLNEAILRLTLRNRILAQSMPSKEEWDIIIGSMPQLADVIIPAYIKEYYNRITSKPSWSKEDFETASDFLPIYLQSLGVDIAADIIYPYFNDIELSEVLLGSKFYDKFNRVSKRLVALDIAESGGILAYHKVLELFSDFEKNRNLIFDLLDIKKQFYDKDDLRNLELIVNNIKSLPSTRKVEQMTTGIFSKKLEDVAICHCGKKLPDNEEYCPECKRNAQGLTEVQQEILKDAEIMVAALKELLS